ncbi:type II toxin-antitoxin system VapC family toxin [Diaphorobacter sp.]|uniref:type II toxin-antitoxin system VapC family toxin n=1 Tax=Diaphorobacter sp. TaxID=1934310 RepID=UPI003D0E1E2F
MTAASARYLLDTSICIRIAMGHPQAVRDRFARHALHELALSVVTVGELRFGAERSQSRDQALATIERLVQLIGPRPLPMAAAEHYGHIRAALHGQSQSIGNNDLWLAAHARAEGWTLVTHHARALARVPGLQIENWGD